MVQHAGLTRWQCPVKQLSVIVQHLHGKYYVFHPLATIRTERVVHYPLLGAIIHVMWYYIGVVLQ